MPAGKHAPKHRIITKLLEMDWTSLLLIESQNSACGCYQTKKTSFTVYDGVRGYTELGQSGLHGIAKSQSGLAAFSSLLGLLTVLRSEPRIEEPGLFCARQSGAEEVRVVPPEVSPVSPQKRFEGSRPLRMGGSSKVLGIPPITAISTDLRHRTRIPLAPPPPPPPNTAAGCELASSKHWKPLKPQRTLTPLKPSTLNPKPRNPKP